MLDDTIASAKRTLAILTIGILVACGGSPFEATASELGDAQAEASDDAPIMRGSVDHDAAPERDASSSIDSAPDLMPDAAMPDSSPPADSGPRCTPQHPTNCFGTTTVAPDYVCWYQNGTHGAATTPAACRACGLYTCSCVLPFVSCAVKSCSDSNDEVVILCQ